MGETAGAELSEGELMRQFMQQMQQHMQQLQRMVEPLQAKIGVLEKQQASSALIQKANTRRQSMAPFSLSSPISEYSASAAIPMPPVVGHPGRRSSHGRPYPAATPATPAKQVNFDDDAEVDTGQHDELEESAMSDKDRRAEEDKYEKQWENASKALTARVKPFYGQASRDTDNVVEWTEQINTVFSIRMKDREEGRLDLVRQMLAGSALKWMNRRVQEMNDLVSNRVIKGPVEWKLLQQPFIDAHLGINTIETFKAELRTLRLGSTKCPTPVEFNKEFDHLVEMAYPDRRDNSMDTVLGDEYATLIGKSRRDIFTSVTLNQLPSTLEEWKLCVSRRWAAGKALDAMDALTGKGGGQPAQQKGRGGYGGWKGRGGGTAGQSTQPAASAAAMNVEDSSSSQDGETLTVEEENDEQPSAAGSFRGGRGGGRGGGRSGRGGGGGSDSTGRMPRLSEERLKKLAEDGRCFRCGQTGHIARGCSNPRVDLTKA